MVCLHKSTPEMDGPVFTIRSLAALGGVTPDTISTMRRRKRALEAGDRKPTGFWSVDISDKAAALPRSEPLGDTLKAALKETLGDLIREA
jgi:hypothetical protein